MDSRAAPAGAGPGPRAASRRAQPRGAVGMAFPRSRPAARQPQPHRSRRPHPHTGPAGGTAGRPRGPAAAGRLGGCGGGADVTRSGAPHTPTLLLYAQDHQGLGHITRTLTIARRVLAAYPTFVAYIATKSPVAANFTLPERCDYIKLPTLLTAEGVERSPAEEEAAKQRFRTIRGQILRAAALGLAPDLVLVDHEPLGAKGEFREGLYALKAQCPGTKFVFGLRDIMDDVGRIQGQWRELGVYDALEQLYDGIAVYGSAALYDVAEAYDIPAAVQPKLHYCGYVVRDPPALDRDAVRQQLGLPPGGPLIVATVGSGSDGYPVLEAAQAAVERLGAQVPGLHAVMVTGPFMPAEQQAVLQARATATCRVGSQADNFALMAAADAVVSMGGYNSRRRCSSSLPRSCRPGSRRTAPSARCAARTRIVSWCRCGCVLMEARSASTR